MSVATVAPGTGGPEEKAAAHTGVSATTTGVTSTSLSVVCSYWKEFDLDALRSRLDEAGLKIAEGQEESLQNRRRLAESTREFKKLATEAGGKVAGPLLKQYQEEIDRLTRRAKYAESAFLGVYQSLYEAPDPAPVLTEALATSSSMNKLKAENTKTAQELAEYKAESTKIKNQELTVRKLEDRARTLEADLEERNAQIEQLKNEAAAEADAAVVAQMQEREQQLSSTLQEAQTNLSSLQQLFTASQNQMFALQSTNEAQWAGQERELALASVEMERLQKRLMALEQEKQQLLQDTADKRRHAGPGDGGQRNTQELRAQESRGVEAALRQELDVQRRLAARLQDEASQLKRQLRDEQEMAAVHTEGLRSSLAAQEQHAQALAQELSSKPSRAQLEDLKQQIRILQAVGYNSMESDDRDPSTTSTDTSLESLLLQKNRHLEHECIMSRLKVSDALQQAESRAQDVKDLEAQVAQQRNLINKLEADIGAAKPALPEDGDDAWAALSGSATPMGVEAGGGGGGGGASRAVSRVNSGAVAEDASMVKVLCDQRDRLRAKVQQLEEQVSQLHTELHAAKSEAATARADNVALVGRLRYVHGYGQEQDRQQREADVEGGRVEGKYAKLYEDSVNPFREFQGQQRERRKRMLPVTDRAMFLFGDVIFGSPKARLIAFCYLVCLHFLVFASLVQMNHHASKHIFQEPALLTSNHLGTVLPTP